MPKKQDPSEGDHTTLNIFTGLVICLAIAALVIACFACNDESLTTVDRLARYNLGFEGAFVLTIKKCAEFAAIAGVFIAILAIIGLIGTKQNNKQLTCVYNVGLVICGVIMFILGVHALGRQSEMEPIITRQVTSLCVEPTFIRLTQQLNCPDTAGPLAIAAGHAASPCGAACEARVATLSHTGEGCLLLTGLCNNFNYVSLSVATGIPVASVMDGPPSGGSLVVNSLAPSPELVFLQPFFLAANFDAVRCERKCDHDMLCTGFQPNLTSCLIKSANVTRYATPDWTVDTTQATGTAQMKRDNTVLASFTTIGYGVALLLLLIGLALIVMWLLTMRILYNQNINKPGKPNAHQVGLMLCCPCLGGDEYQDEVPIYDGTDYDPEE